MTLIVAGCAGSSSQCSSHDAQGVVKALQSKEQFRAMLNGVTERTQTVAMARKRDGLAAPRNLAEAIDRAVERHGAEWERNLVNSWSNLSSAEIEQVCSALREKDRSTFISFAERVAPAVQSRNEPLLKRAAVEVLDAVWSASS
jgi:hypothetical protein